MPRTLLIALLLAMASGCVKPNSFKAFQKKGMPKAAFDLDCPESELEAESLGPGSVGVTGCGKRARYEYVSGTGWVENGSAK